MAREIVVTLANGERAGETLKALRHQAAALNKEISTLKPETEEFVKASASLNQVKGRMGDIEKQVKATGSASEMLRKAWDQLPGAQFFNQVADSFGMMKQGVGGLVSQFGVLKAAIAATGIGVLVLVLGALVNWMMKVESITNVVKGAFDALTSAWNTLIKAIATFDFSNLGQKMATAAKEGYNLVQAFDELEDKARDIELANAKSQQAVEQLLLQSRNVQLSYEERIALLNQASQIELANHSKRLEYAREFEATVQREVDNANRQGEASDELKDKLLAAQKAVIDAERESINLQEKIANRRSALEEKRAAEAERTAERLRKQREKEDAELDKYWEQRLEKDNKQEAQRLEIQNNMAQQANQMRIENAKAAMLAVVEQFQKETKAFEDNAKKQEQIETAKRMMMAESLSVFNQGTDSIIALLGADEKARRRNAQVIKDIESGRVIVNGIAEVSEIAKTFAALGPPGQVLAALRIAFSVARTAAGVIRIQSTKFRRGGILEGPSHEQGGIPVMVNRRYAVEAEGGEPILTAGVSRNPFLLAQASAINVAAGGRPLLRQGGVVSPSNPFNQASPAPAMGIDMEALANLIDSRMDRKVRTIRVQNVITDTREKLSTLLEVENEWNV